MGSLTPRRDLTYVADTAWAFVLVAETPDIEGEVIHFGGAASGFRGTTGATLPAQRRGRARVVSVQERQRPEKSEVRLLLCQPAKARRLLGWETTRRN